MKSTRSSSASSIKKNSVSPLFYFLLFILFLLISFSFCYVGSHLGVLMSSPGVTGLLFNALDPEKTNAVDFKGKEKTSI